MLRYTRGAAFRSVRGMSTVRNLPILDRFVRVEVGGISFSVSASDLAKHPGSFFGKLAKEDKLHQVDRNASLFKYVNAFLVNGDLPRDASGKVSLDEATLLDLKREADFFGLPALNDACGSVSSKTNEPDLNTFMTFRKYLNRYHGYHGFESEMNVEFNSPLIRSLAEIWSPFCLTGDCSGTNTKLYKNSTVYNFQMDELSAAATQSPFGRGMETVVDTSVRNSFEIPASELNPKCLKEMLFGIDVSPLAPTLNLELRPYKLVIYKEGGHFDAHRDTVRGEGHIGTLVVVLNSRFTGGELEVTHDGRTEIVTGAYSWVAMYGDCLHKINPVTSGERVSLIYDIYGTPVVDTEADRGRYNAIYDRSKTPPLLAYDAKLRGLSEEQRDTVHTCVKYELLNNADSLIITLQHLYPECQTSPAFLKGGDRALYDLLSEQFDVQVVAATIYRTDNYIEDIEPTTMGFLFTPAMVKHAAESPDSESPVLSLSKKPRVKLLILDKLKHMNLMDYTPFAEQTGNEPQDEENVYIVAGLQVRRK